MRVRSARNRSRENSIGSPSGSVVVLVIAISGAPGSTSRMAASSGRGQDHLDPLHRVGRLGAEVLLEQLVHRAAERQLEQPGKAPGREPGVLEGERAAVREPDPHQVDDELTGADAQRLRGEVVRLGQPRAEHPGPGDHALAAQQRGHPDDAGQVPLDLALGHERAAAAARHPADHAALGQHGQRLAQRRPADPELGRERPLGAEPLPGAQSPAADLLGQRAPDLLGRPRGSVMAFPFRLIAAMASGDSGRTCPPSTTIVWPVM